MSSDFNLPLVTAENRSAEYTGIEVQPGLSVENINVKKSRLNRFYRPRSLCFKHRVSILVFAFVLSTASLVVVWLRSGTLHNNSAFDATCYTSQCFQISHDLIEDTRVLDENFTPCNDFYHEICSKWPRNHKTSNQDEETKSVVEHLIEHFLKSQATPNEPKIINQTRQMYHSCIENKPEIEKLAISKILRSFQLPNIPSILNENDDNSTVNEFNFLKSIAAIKKATGINIILNFDIIANQTNHLRKGIKLGIPSDERTPLTSDDTQYIVRSGLDIMDPTFNQCLVNRLNAIVEIESNLNAESSNKQNYEWTNITEFQNHLAEQGLKSNIELREYLEIIFDGTSIDISQQLIFANSADIEFIQKVLTYFAALPKAEQELYIWFRVMDELSSKNNDCVHTIQQSMPMLASYALLEPDFVNTTKPKVLEMMENIRAAFQELVKNAEWVDADTKALLIEKSEATQFDIGFPDWLLDEDKLQEYYEGLNLTDASYIENIVRALRFDMNIKLKSLNIPGNTGWDMKPIEVNARHERSQNIITIPAAILRYPFFNLGLDVLDYGAIGAILGHEFGHGFDDSGRRFDKNGNFIEEWKVIKTLEEYKTRAECFRQQYDDTCVPEIGITLNGTQTLDENISDNVGLLLAYNAYKMHVAKNGVGKKLPHFEKFTHDQLFFMAYANRWCNAETSEELKRTVQTDSHSPHLSRVNNVLRNSNEFRQAYQCSAKSKMVSTSPCRIW